MHALYDILTVESKRYRKKAKETARQKLWTAYPRRARRERNKSKAVARERRGRNRSRRIGRWCTGLRTGSFAARGRKNEAGPRRVPTEEHVARSGNDGFALPLSSN